MTHEILFWIATYTRDKAHGQIICKIAIAFIGWHTMWKLLRFYFLLTQFAAELWRPCVAYVLYCNNPFQFFLFAIHMYIQNIYVFFFSVSKFFHSPEYSASAFRTLLGEKFLTFFDPTQHLIIIFLAGITLKEIFSAITFTFFEKSLWTFYQLPWLILSIFFWKQKNFWKSDQRKWMEKNYPSLALKSWRKNVNMDSLLLKIICLYQTGITLWPKSHSQKTILIFILQ